MVVLNAAIDFREYLRCPLDASKNFVNHQHKKPPNSFNRIGG